jgi:hypothetical protein
MRRRREREEGVVIRPDNLNSRSRSREGLKTLLFVATAWHDIA